MKCTPCHSNALARSSTMLVNGSTASAHLVLRHPVVIQGVHNVLDHCRWAGTVRVHLYYQHPAGSCCCIAIIHACETATHFPGCWAPSPSFSPGHSPPQVTTAAVTCLGSAGGRRSSGAATKPQPGAGIGAHTHPAAPKQLCTAQASRQAGRRTKVDGAAGAGAQRVGRQRHADG